jgi:hypothetical protein
MGRDPQPSAGIVDSQSVKTTAWEESAATMVGRRLREESVIYS